MRMFYTLMIFFVFVLTAWMNLGGPLTDGKNDKVVERAFNTLTNDLTEVFGAVPVSIALVLVGAFLARLFYVLAPAKYD